MNIPRMACALTLAAADGEAHHRALAEDVHTEPPDARERVSEVRLAVRLDHQLHLADGLSRHAGGQQLDHLRGTRRTERGL